MSLDFITAAPAWVRLLLAIGITVTVTVVAAQVFRSRIVALKEKNDDIGDLSGVVTTVTTYLTIGFVFFIGFTMSQFWSSGQDARSALREESQAITRAVALTRALSEGAARDAIQDALQAYMTTVESIEWPLLRAGEVNEAESVQTQAATALAGDVFRAEAGLPQSDASLTPQLNTAIDKIITSGGDRVTSSPTTWTTPWFGAVGLLGFALLVISTMFRFSGLRVTQVLLGVFATVLVTLFFVMLELSNPFGGSAGLQPPQWSTTISLPQTAP